MAEERYTLAYPGAELDEAIARKEATPDYIVAAGSSGGWRWKKFASGDAVLWGIHSVTPTENNESGQMFYSDILEVATPFGIANAAVVGACDNLHTVVNTNNSYSEQKVSFRLERPTAINTGAAVTVKLIAWGVWNV